MVRAVLLMRMHLAFSRVTAQRRTGGDVIGRYVVDCVTDVAAADGTAVLEAVNINSVAFTLHHLLRHAARILDLL